MPDTDQSPAKPEPADLETFDLDGFIAGIVQPSKVVAISQNRALGQQIQEAAQTYVDLKDEERAAKAEGRATKRRAASTESPELEAARKELTDLEEQAASTFVFVRIEGGLTRNTRKQALKDTEGDADQNNLAFLSMSAKVHKNDPRTHPDSPGKVLSLAQWEEFSEAIGYMQYDAVLDAMIEVSNVGVSPDFSQPASPSPDGDTSSKS